MEELGKKQTKELTQTHTDLLNSVALEFKCRITEKWYGQSYFLLSIILHQQTLCKNDKDFILLGYFHYDFVVIFI